MSRSIPLLALAVLLGGPTLLAGQADPLAGRLTALSADHPRPGDVVKLRIWREPDLSGEFPVDAQGEVVLPRLGAVPVTDLTTSELEQNLVSAYSRFLRHNSIDVTLLRRVQITGAVRNPGLYPVDETMTLSDAVALAGGATTEGVMNKVVLVRDGKRVATHLTASTRIAGSPIRSGDQLIVPQRSWISRNTGVVAAGLSASVSLVIAFLTR